MTRPLAGAVRENAMAAYLIAEFVVKDPEKMRQYAALAGPVVREFGGKVLVRAPAKVLVGQSRTDVGVVIEFDSLQTIERFLASEAYHPAIPIRDAAAEATFLAVEAP